MDIAKTIEDFFSMINSYIELLVGYLENADMIELLNYLFLCIPVEVRAILIVLLLLMIVLGIRNAFKG